MSNFEVERKIAVILVADVVGYSKHMERNENATLEAYSECEKLLKEALDKRQGSIFNTAGDSVLAEFTSAVNAVEFAVEFQNKIKERNKSDSISAKLEFRIGINMGDVVSREGNLLGDGVNIAARLEALSQPNGICISKSIYDLVVPKTQMNFNDLGVQKVKQNSFHAYDVLLDPSQKRKIKKKGGVSSAVPLLAGILALGILVAGYLLYFPSSQVSTSEETTFQETSRPTVLVAPLKASGLDSDMKGFADGVTESMVSAFSTYKGVKVLSSNTSFHTIEKNMTDDQMRSEYGVKFIIRGSIQVMGENARLNLEVTDTAVGEVVATKKRDFALTEIFTVQDEMSSEILELLQLDLGVGKYARTFAHNFNNIEDLTTFLNWIRVWRRGTIESHEEAQGLFDQLKAKYTNENAAMYVMEAWQLSQRLLMQLSSKPEIDKERLKFILDRNIDLHPKETDNYNARALISLLNFNGSCEDAIKDIKQAETNGQNQETLLIGAGVYTRCGEKKRAISSLQKVLKIVPNDPGWFQTGFLVTLLYEDKQFEEIYKVIGDKIKAEDIDSRVLAIYAVLEVKNGNTEKARGYFERSLKNGFRWDRFSSYGSDLRTETLDTLENLIKFERGDQAN
ncbi:adenylate/guanylate cyclase domain-containing protein [Rhodobacteraceae bacterium]|nr:adenylate/guanylate cyclase domain-containing protein [Paracoccaceae bacterium]